MSNLYKLVQEEIKKGNIPENYIHPDQSVNLSCYQSERFSKKELEKELHEDLIENDMTHI